jgi:broad specificity phosphatase PhoE
MAITSKIILVRHLATPNNRNRIIMGRSIDASIVPDEQVQEFETKITALAQQYDIHGDHVTLLSSPLKRCLDTSNLIRDVLESSEPVTVIDELIETDMGQFEGHTGSDLKAEFPDLVEQWMHRPEGFRFPGGESYDEVAGRVDQVMKRLLEMDTENHIFVCTHVDLIKMVLLKLQGKGFNERRSIDVTNGSIVVLERDPAKQSLRIVSS